MELVTIILIGFLTGVILVAVHHLLKIEKQTVKEANKLMEEYRPVARKHDRFVAELEAEMEAALDETQYCPEPQTPMELFNSLLPRCSHCGDNHWGHPREHAKQPVHCHTCGKTYKGKKGKKLKRKVLKAYMAFVEQLPPHHKADVLRLWPELKAALEKKARKQHEKHLAARTAEETDETSRRVSRAA